MPTYKVVYHYKANNKKLFFMNAHAKDRKIALTRVRKIIKKPIVVDTVKDTTFRFVIIRDIIHLSLLGLKFIKQLALIFLAVDVALRYHIDGIEKKNELIAIFIAVFGIYGLMSYGIRIAEKELNKIENKLDGRE